VRDLGRGQLRARTRHYRRSADTRHRSRIPYVACKGALPPSEAPARSPLPEPVNTPEGNIGPKVSKEQLKTIRARRRLSSASLREEKVASTGRKKYTSVAKIADAVQFNKDIVVSRTTVDEDLIAMGY
jgi:hypothetical protein